LKKRDILKDHRDSFWETAFWETQSYWAFWKIIQVKIQGDWWSILAWWI